MENDEGIRYRGWAERLFTLLLKAIIFGAIITVLGWLMIYMTATSTINKAMDELTGIVTKDNCLDTMTGEYQRFESKLESYNRANLFLKFELKGASAAKRTTGVQGSEVIIWDVKDGSVGDDSFEVRKGSKGGAPNYSLTTAPQRYEPVYVKLTASLYFPTPIFFGERAAEGVNSGTLVATSLPSNKNMPAYKYAMEREATVIGTRYFKGQKLAE